MSQLKEGIPAVHSSNMQQMKRIWIIFFLLISITVNAQIQLPKLISDGMVLQRNTQLNIWGWASAGDSVTIHFQDHTYQTISDQNGGWKVKLPEMAAGGPYEMVISAKDSTIVLQNILIGEVWLCSGQSNMQFTMAGAKYKYAHSIANSTNAVIRHFEVPKHYNLKEPQDDLSGGQWVEAHPESVLSFSAVAYFFGRTLYDKYKVPIGLINASVGGSPAQAWMSKEALKDFPNYLEESEKYTDLAYVQMLEQKHLQQTADWHEQARASDQGIQDSQSPWFANHIDRTSWLSIMLPDYVNPVDNVHPNGVVWFSRTIDVPRSFLDGTAQVKLGRIMDADSVYINGTWVGATSHQWATRTYNIPEGLLQSGRNQITVRVVNWGGRAGFVKGYPLTLATQTDTLDLRGSWRYQIGAKMPPLASSVVLQWIPTGLFNNMIAPLTNYKIKGVIWYQGEGNVSKAQEYVQLFPTLIQDWRKKWQDSDLPFLFVQLANFGKVVAQPQASAWALLREAQLKTLAFPNTGMAVAIDIGEWNDVHPKNKEDVGKRLALAAQKIAYKEKIVFSGPLYKSMRIRKGRAILTFNHFGSKWIWPKGEAMPGFAIAGNDKHFVWANAKIKGNKVIVWSDAIKEPVAVRYAWANNPGSVSLINAEGVPASPFRTDQWEP